jgi:hypothetical protein
MTKLATVFHKKLETVFQNAAAGDGDTRQA